MKKRTETPKLKKQVVTESEKVGEEEIRKLRTQRESAPNQNQQRKKY